jgi:hypothetical protein
MEGPRFPRVFTLFSLTSLGEIRNLFPIPRGKRTFLSRPLSCHLRKAPGARQIPCSSFSKTYLPFLFPSFWFLQVFISEAHLRNSDSRLVIRMLHFMSPLTYWRNSILLKTEFEGRCLLEVSASDGLQLFIEGNRNFTEISNYQ